VVMLAMSVSFGALFVYVVRHPALLEPEVDPTVLRASIRRFTLIGLALYAATVIVALFSAPACLVLHFLIALYYCFEQIRIRSA